MIECQCNCGAVSFETPGPLRDIYICHCSICRRFSGGVGMPVLIVANDAFRWVRGEAEVKVWAKPDADWEANFCCTCGSALPGRNDEGTYFIPAGLLPDDVGPLEVKHHIFVGSKAHWDRIGDTGKQHRGAFGG